MPRLATCGRACVSVVGRKEGEWLANRHDKTLRKRSDRARGCPDGPGAPASIETRTVTRGCARPRPPLWATILCTRH